MASTTITVSAAQYEDADDCLAAAAADYAAEHGLDGWDLEPRWVGGDEGDREEIELTVPVHSIDTDRYLVMGYDTANTLDGAPSADLVAASLAAGSTGAVAAYRDGEGVWQHVREDEVEHYRRLGEDVVTVYVEIRESARADHERAHDGDTL